MAEFKFEKKLSDLEKLVNDMEQGELTLDKSMVNYEKGIKLVRECQAALEQAEQKISIMQDKTLKNYTDT